MPGHSLADVGVAATADPPHSDVQIGPNHQEGVPCGRTNLAADRTKSGDLVIAMSAKLESTIAAEIGVDDGSELPDVEGIDWALPQERFD